MHKVLHFQTLEVLDRMKLVKEFYDEGSFRIVDFMGKMGVDYDDYELYCWESLDEVAQNVDRNDLFYEEDEDITEDSEPYGEVWDFSSDDLREYYKLLRELKESNRITADDYAKRKKDMEDCICRYVLDTQCYYYGGIGLDITDDGISPNADGVRIYIDFNCSFDFFCLFCGLVAVFDKYTNLLNELKGMLADEKRLLEAA